MMAQTSGLPFKVVFLPKEKVKDIDFNEVETFNTNELLSFQAFLNSCKDKIDLNSLNSGTIFFLKLGDEKFDSLA